MLGSIEERKRNHLVYSKIFLFKPKNGVISIKKELKITGSYLDLQEIRSRGNSYKRWFYHGVCWS
jgi:hypothetical protein